MKKFILIFTVFLICNSAYSQLNNDIDREILAYITKNVMDFPQTESNALPFQSIDILSKELKTVFIDYKILTIEKAFKNFQDKDTIVKNELGIGVKIPQFSRIYKIKLTRKEDVVLAINDLSKINGILYAEKNGTYELCNDPEYNRQWHLKNNGQNGGIVGADIKAEQTWQIFSGTNSVKIGIIDDGVMYFHEDLTPKTSGGYTAGNYHGTHVAGIAAAYANNNKGGRGVDWNAIIHSQSILGLSDDAIANEVVNAVNTNCLVLNCSWRLINGYSSTVKFAFIYAYKMNRVSVAAMGNFNNNVTQYPAGFGQGIIAVGSTNNRDLKSSFSNFGSHIDVTAPGGDGVPFDDPRNIISTFGPSYNTYAGISGTSMSAPVVTGIASLLKGYNSNLCNDDIENLIKLSADDKGSPGWDDMYGNGRVNAYKAIKFLMAPYQLNYYSSTGGSDISSTEAYQMPIYGSSSLADGNYLVKRHEVKKTVNFPNTVNPRVWGRGLATTGWTSSNPNFTTGYTELVEGTVTNNSAQLRTYVYEVWATNGTWLGWHPAHPNNVNFAYSVLGEQMQAPVIANLSQYPNPMCPSHNFARVYCNLAQGNGAMTYNWSFENIPNGITIDVEPNTNYVTIRRTQLESKDITKDATLEFKIKCVAQNSVGSSPICSLFVGMPGTCPSIGCPTLSFDIDNNTIDENTLLLKSPNYEFDITDYYLMRFPGLSSLENINFKIHEPEYKVNLIDNISIIRAEVEEDEEIGVTDEGEIINYNISELPTRITMDDKLDITEQLSFYDNNNVLVKSGNHLRIEPPDKRTTSTKYLIIKTIAPIVQKESLIGTIYLWEREFDTLYTRLNDNVLCVKLLPDINYADIFFAQEFEIDQILMVSDLGTASLNTLLPNNAKHNTGDVITELLEVDENYAQIDQDENIDFSFPNPQTDYKSFYILKTVGRYVDAHYTSINENKSKIILNENYPNPFNPITKISFFIPTELKVTLKIYDIAGREVASIINDFLNAGEHEVTFNGINLASGIYFYRIQAGDFAETKRMVLIK